MSLEAERRHAGAEPWPGHEFRGYRAGDEHELVALFNRVFRADPAGPPPRTLEEWRWLFRDAPGGFRLRVAEHAGRIVAQSAGIGYRVRCDGRETRFSQSVDSLVDPGHRNGLKKPGLFVRTVEPYIAAYARTPDLVFFGWPNRAAFRIGQAFLGYELVRRQELLVRARIDGARTLPSRVQRVLDLDGDDAQRSVDALWARCARHLGASTIRDAAFLRWRFLAAPAQRYELLGLRDGRGLAGLAVLRHESRAAPGGLVIADWLVPEDEPDAGAELLAGVLALARQLDSRAVVALFPPWSRWAAHFARADFEGRPSDCFLTARSHDPAHDVAWLREHWWYQLAESDVL